MRYFQEMTHQEMAEQIDEPLNNIKIKLLRAKKLLAEIISGKLLVFTFPKTFLKFIHFLNSYF